MTLTPRRLLRVEGLTALALALGGYATLGGPLWLLAVLALAPDLSMLAYLRGPRVGAAGYNLAHTYALPAALGTLGHLADVRVATLVALVWAAHVGADRALGYGLKFDSGFRDTHLSRQPAPIAALTRDE